MNTWPRSPVTRTPLRALARALAVGTTGAVLALVYLFVISRGRLL
ncbi:hypothetical protein [Streptomyces sp. JW3]